MVPPHPKVDTHVKDHVCQKNQENLILRVPGLKVCCGCRKNDLIRFPVQYLVLDE